MNNQKFRCKKCGSEVFAVGETVQDYLFFEATIYEDGNYDTTNFIKDYGGGDTIETDNEFECRECGATYYFSDLTGHK